MKALMKAFGIVALLLVGTVLVLGSQSQTVLALSSRGTVAVALRDQYNNPGPLVQVVMTDSIGAVYREVGQNGYADLQGNVGPAIVQVGAITRSVVIVADTRTDIMFQVVSPVPSPAWMQTLQQGNSFSWKVDRDMIFPYRWECNIIENGVSLYSLSSCPGTYNNWVGGFEVGVHYISMVAVAPDKSLTVSLPITLVVEPPPAVPPVEIGIQAPETAPYGHYPVRVGYYLTNTSNETQTVVFSTTVGGFAWGGVTGPRTTSPEVAYIWGFGEGHLSADLWMATIASGKVVSVVLETDTFPMNETSTDWPFVSMTLGDQSVSRTLRLTEGPGYGGGISFAYPSMGYVQMEVTMTSQFMGRFKNTDIQSNCASSGWQVGRQSSDWGWTYDAMYGYIYVGSNNPSTCYFTATIQHESGEVVGEFQVYGSMVPQKVTKYLTINWVENTCTRWEITYVVAPEPPTSIDISPALSGTWATGQVSQTISIIAYWAGSPGVGASGTIHRPQCYYMPALSR